jgi:hypothetical protein
VKTLPEVRLTGQTLVIYDEKINHSNSFISTTSTTYLVDGERLSLCQPTIIFALVTIKPSKWYTASMTKWKLGVNCVNLQNAIQGILPEDSPVRRRITAPSVMVPTSNSDYKSMGFSKLVKRDDGVYENVTATDNESKVVKPGDRSTYPDFNKKISD